MILEFYVCMKLQRLYYLVMYQSVLNHATYHLDMIQILFLVSNLTFFGFCSFLVIYVLTLFSKCTFKHIFAKVLRAKWPHGTYGNMFLSQSGLHVGSAIEVSIFSLPPPCGEAPNGFSKMFCTDDHHFYIFLACNVFFWSDFELKRTHIEISRTSVQKSARELPSETSSCTSG